MMGAAVLVGRGLLPMHAVDLALLAPLRLQLPLAPAEGLVLLNAGFARNANGQAAAITAEAAGHADDDVLMTPLEEELCERFLVDSIRTKVLEDWQAHDSKLVSDWLQLASRYKPSGELNDEWKSLADHHIKLNEQEEEDKANKERARIAHSVNKFRSFLLKMQAESGNDSAELSQEWLEDPSIQQHMRLRLLREKDSVQHKVFLPNSISTDVVMRFGTVPGREVSEALRALATQVVLGKLPMDLTPQQLIDVMMLEDSSHQKIASDEDEDMLRRSRLRRWAYEQPKLKLIK